MNKYLKGKAFLGTLPPSLSLYCHKQAYLKFKQCVSHGNCKLLHQIILTRNMGTSSKKYSKVHYFRHVNGTSSFELFLNCNLKRYSNHIWDIIRTSIKQVQRKIPIIYVRERNAVGDTTKNWVFWDVFSFFLSFLGIKTTQVNRFKSFFCWSR